MARSIEEIYNEMVAKKQSFVELQSFTPQYATNDNPYQQLLDGLSTGSVVSIWRLWLFLVAAIHYTIEVMFDAFKSEADLISKRNTFGSLPWYRDRVLAFQFNFQLVWNSQYYLYNYTDTTSQAAIDARVVKYVSCQEVKRLSYNVVLVKVATGDVVLNPIPATELAALESYVERIKPPGIKTEVTSFPADLLRPKLKIWYDGTLDPDLFITSIENGIKSFLKAIEFDGIFHVDNIIVALKKIPGVVNIQVEAIDAKAFNGNWAAITESYNPTSGYFELVATGATANDTQITLIAA